MKKFTLITLFLLPSSLFSEIEILDRVAVIVDDGVIMESQVKSGLENMISRYDEQNIPKPPIDDLKSQVIESLIIEFFIFDNSLIILKSHPGWGFDDKPGIGLFSPLGLNIVEHQGKSILSSHFKSSSLIALSNIS